MENQPIEPVQQFTHSQIPPAHSRRAMVISITVGILILAGGAFAYTKLASKPVATPSPSPTTTTGWKTYTNTQYGFSFKYPPTWKAYEFDSYVLIGDTTISQDERKCLTREDFLTNYYLCRRIIFEFKSFNAPSLASYLSTQHYTSPDGNPVQPEMLGNIEGFDLASTPFGYVVYDPNLKRGIIMGNGFFDIDFTHQILSTFKFTASLDTSDWKTYINSEYEFGLRYPGNFRKIDSVREIPLTFSSESAALRSLSHVSFEHPGIFPTKLEIGFYGEILTNETKFDLGHDFVLLSDRQYVMEKTLASNQKTYVLGPFGILGSPCEYTRAFIPLTSGTVVLALETCSTRESEENGLPDGPSDSAVAEMRTLLDQILSTFTFTGSTANWKTYTNTQYGYSVKHPTDWNPADCSAESKNNCQGFLEPGSNGFSFEIQENIYSTLAAMKTACQQATFDGQPNCLSYKEEQVVLGSTLWWKITSTHHPDLTGGSATIVVYWTSHNNTTFFVHPFSDTELQALFTFQFTK